MAQHLSTANYPKLALQYLMQPYQLQTITASKQNLIRLCIIRCIALSGQWLAFIYAHYGLQIDLKIIPIVLALSTLSILTIVTFLRIQKPWPVIEIEFFIHLLIDILGLSVLVFYSGGASNPFISYYLIPISISAAVLPWMYTWVITGTCIFLYSIMLYYYIPLPFLEPHLGHTSYNNSDNLFSNIHIMGMWANFAISSILITFFVVKMAKALRKQESTILLNQEQNHKNEQLISVATLAAGTAHELGTPLSTMAILLTEIENEYTSNQSLSADIALLKQQVKSCKKILQALTATAEKNQTEMHELLPIDTYIHKLVDYWKIMRPGISCNINISSLEHKTVPSLNASPILDQAITNLLNNAADASLEHTPHNPSKIEITILWDENNIIISIKDHGKGISNHVMENIGKPFISAKGKGLGLGLFLTQTTITRLGGQVNLHNHEEGGTIATIKLPYQTKETP